MRALLLSLILAVSAFAQTGDPLADVLDSIKEGYNKADTSIYTKHFSSALRATHEDNQLMGFFKNAALGWGKMKSFGTPQRQDGGRVVVSAAFDKADTQLTLVLDKDNKLTHLTFKEMQSADFDNPLQASVFFRFPLKGAWKVAEGGGTREQNAHHDSRDEAFAMDFIRLTDEKAAPPAVPSKTFADDPTYGQEILCPAAGTVGQLLDGIPENTPGSANAMSPWGNVLAIRYGKEEFFLISHLKGGSFKIRAGEACTPGQPLALSGASGSTSRPLVTFNVRNNIAGQKGRSMKFGFACVEAFDGKSWSSRVNYMPVKGDILRDCPEELKK
jgi:hypothetical protein